MLPVDRHHVESGGWVDVVETDEAPPGAYCMALPPGADSSRLGSWWVVMGEGVNETDAVLLLLQFGYSLAEEEP